jgi:hypothetical protein
MHGPARNKLSQLAKVSSNPFWILLGSELFAAATLHGLRNPRLTWGGTMPLFTDPCTTSEWSEALEHMQSAMRILDETRAPDDIGPHLDMAMCRLEEALGRNKSDNSVRSLRQELEAAFLPVDQTAREAAVVW